MLTQPTTLNIHPELQGLIPPLSDDERRQLLDNLRDEGCRDAIVVWQEENAILDGHHRYDICQTYEIPFETRPLSLPDLDAAKVWMLSHQLGRRNLSPQQMSYLRGKQRKLIGQKRGGDRKSEKSLRQNVVLKTDAQLADEHKVDVRTLQRDSAFAKDVDVITEAVPEAKQAILSRDTKLARKEVKAIAGIAKENPQAAKNVMAEVKKAATPKAAKQVIRKAAKAQPTTPPSKEEVPGEPALPRPEVIKSADGKDMYSYYNPASQTTFDRTTEMVDLASWAWNPVTGCWHGCDYCSARAIANRWPRDYPAGFAPTFYPARLDAPAKTAVPKAPTQPADKNVYTCSMADLFGTWVPDEWIMAVFERVKRHQEWNFLFLTQFPQRLQAVCQALGGFPPNTWIGCTVNEQARVETAEGVFRNIQAPVKWLSVEPMRERLTFKSLDIFDLVVMGGQNEMQLSVVPTYWVRARQPEWEWVEHLWQQARAAGVPVYWKESLTARPKEMPRQPQLPSAETSQALGESNHGQSL
jgi:protein gp37